MTASGNGSAKPIRSRSTADLVILILAGFVGVTVMLTAASIFFVEVWRPEQDTSGGVTALAGVINTSVSVILGGIAGFVAGRGSARGNSIPAKANGG